MALKLMYITNNKKIASIADAAGVDWIVVDIEIIGKELRQGMLGTLIAGHQISDISIIKKNLINSRLLVRINPIHDDSETEINEVINAGAEIIMLPHFKTLNEAKLFLAYVNQRVETCLLIETKEAVNIVDDLIELSGVNYFHIGLNDLHQSQMKVFPYELLIDGTVEAICKKLSNSGKKFGVGGFARLGQGDVPAEDILIEEYRLGASMAILSRTFCSQQGEIDLDEIKMIFTNGISEIREFEIEISNKDTLFFEEAHMRLSENIMRVTDKVHRFPVEKLRTILVEMMEKIGMSNPHALHFIDSLINADLAGIKTHGIRILPSHISKIKQAGYNLNPELLIKEIDQNMGSIDGQGTFGPVVMNHAMRYGLQKIKDKSLYGILSYNNNTVGSLGQYCNIATEEGYIVIIATNTTAAMAPWNGIEKLFGTNPIAIGIPSRSKPPIILDMSLSQVAKSKILINLQEGRNIPNDWAFDQKGKPTVDPVEAIKGNMMPLGGHKGYGLALAVDILTGLLSGAGYLDKTKSFYRDMDKSMNVGFSIFLINPQKIMGEQFYDLVDAYIDKVKTSEPLANQQIFLPGEIEAINIKKNTKKGVQLCTQTLNEIKCFIKEYELSHTLD